MKNKEFYPLTFYQCLMLLHHCMQKNLLSSDPKNQDNILVYREAGTDFPAGWYSENVHSAAQELISDIAGQQFLLEQLSKKGISEEKIRSYTVGYHSMEYAGCSPDCFDKWKEQEFEEILSKFSVSDLIRELRNREDVVAVQVWLREDLKNALEVNSYAHSDEAIDVIAFDAQNALEDCSDGWDKISSVISNHRKQLPEY